jgi:threonine dehydrogenase-like Zn-dependent dehydrogenase
VLGVGTVGMLAMQIAKAGGAQVFAIDTRQMSLDLAGDLGADATIRADDPHVDNTLRELTNGDGPDVIIDAAGAASAPADAFQSVGPGGRVVLVAIYTDRPQFDFNSVVGAEKEIVGSISYVQRECRDCSAPPIRMVP